MTATRRPARRTRSTRLAGIALVAPLSLGLAACGDSDDDSDDAPAATVTVTATPSPTASGDSTTAASPSAPTTDGATAGGDVQTAAQTALGAVDGTVFTVDRDDSGGWEVSVVGSDGTDNEVGIAADGTTVTRGPAVDTDDDGDDQAERERLLGASVDYLAAVEAAQAQVPGGTVTGVDLDEDNGTATWEVQLDEGTADETTVDVDASTGEVLRTERDD
jgi:hypothetical protein